MKNISMLSLILSISVAFLHADVIETVARESITPQTLELTREVKPIFALPAGDKGIHTQDNHRDTLLHIAIKNNDIPEAIALLNRGADITIKDSNENTPLGIAIKNNQKDLVKHMLQSTHLKNALHIQDLYNDTPLHKVLKQGNNWNDIAFFMIKQGANISTPDKWGDSPLNIAIKNNQKELVLQILQSPQLKNALILKDFDQDTPLHKVLKKDATWHDVVVQMVAQGADVNTKDRLGITPMQYITQKNDQNLIAEVRKAQTWRRMQDNAINTLLIHPTQRK